MLQERKKNGEAILVLWAQTCECDIVLIKCTTTFNDNVCTFGIGEGNLNTHIKNLNQSQVTDKLTIT